MGLFFESYWHDIFAILISLLLIIIDYFQHSFGYWERKGVPFIPPVIPFGNIKNSILQKAPLGDTMKHIYKHFKSQGYKFGGFYTLAKPQLMIIDPELVKTILSREFLSFSERGVSSNVELEPLTGHLLLLTGSKWRHMRQKLTPTFTSGKMKMMFQIMLACADGLEELLDECVKKNEDIDIKDMLARYATDIIGSSAFGLECNSIKNPDVEFRVIGRKVFQPTSLKVIKNYILRIFPSLFYFLNLRQIDKDVGEFFMNLVADTIEYREKNNIKRNDFLQLLINIKNTGDVDANEININGKKQGEELSLVEIAAQSFLFFMAGFETSSTAMSLFLYDMARYQHIQDKVRREINEMLDRYDGQLTYEGITELKYLENALYESMRLHAAIPILQRKCTEDYKIPDTNVIIEKDTIVLLPVSGLQSDPEHYPNPEKYDPERFSPEEKAKRHPFTFLPFGEGPRNCIGLRFGLLQSKSGICTLLRNHRFTLNKKTKVPLEVSPKSTGLSIIDNIWLNAERI